MLALTLQDSATDQTAKAKNTTDSAPLFSFFGPAGLLSEQPIAHPLAIGAAATVGIAGSSQRGAAGRRPEPLLFAPLFSGAASEKTDAGVDDDDLKFCRSGDYADAERAWIETRGEMTEDYKKRRRAAKRRKTKLRL